MSDQYQKHARSWPHPASREWRLGLHPLSVRALAFRWLRKRILGYERAHYYYCMLNAVRLAKALGMDRISVLEFGVAGGNGLLEIERISNKLKKAYSIQIDIYGFDTGEGLPKPTDYRDLPYQWQEGFFAMDKAELKKRLSTANLVFGDIAETVAPFLARKDLSPIGAIMFDLDYYSSTKASFEIFNSKRRDIYLPRIQCYFDDLATIDSVGVRAALTEFNAAQDDRKIEHPMHLSFQQDYQYFGWKIYEYHDFKHPDYQRPLVEDDQLPLI